MQKLMRWKGWGKINVFIFYTFVSCYRLLCTHSFPHRTMCQSDIPTCVLRLLWRIRSTVTQQKFKKSNTLLCTERKHCLPAQLWAPCAIWDAGSYQRHPHGVGTYVTEEVKEPCGSEVVYGGWDRTCTNIWDVIITIARAVK